MDHIKKLKTKKTTNTLRTYYLSIPISDLKQLKRILDDIYYNTGDEGIEDWKYDVLVDVIKEMDPDYVLEIGTKLRDNVIKVNLPFFMGSMNKIKPEDEIELGKWLAQYSSDEYVVSDKLDGISCLLHYKSDSKRGIYKLYTRGDDGIEGTDISYMSKYINYIPESLNVENMYVRGEIVISIKNFKKYDQTYAKPRNMVTGLVVSSKTVREGIRDLDFVAYEIVGKRNMAKPTDQFHLLSSLGFRVVRHELVPDIDIDILKGLLLRFKDTASYEIDGIIIQSNTSYVRNTSGNPDYAFAFKMMLVDDVKEAIVEEVEWNISKRGILKPRVRIQPLKVSGVTITYATGFNAKFIQDNNIGPNAIIKITRSGDVIPYIIGIVEGTEAQMPDVSYHWNDTNIDIIADEVGKDLCVKVMSNFFSTLKIKYLSDATVNKLYDAGFDSLFKVISAEIDDFLEIEGVKQKSAERMYNNIHDKLQNVELSDLMAGSSIFPFGLGVKKMEALLDKIPDILEIYKITDRDDLLEQVKEVEGFSDLSASKVVDNLQWFDKFLTQLQPYITLKEKEELEDQDLDGQKFVFSGFRDKGLEDQIKQRGGKVIGSVSKQTTAVIIKSKGETSGKIQKAKDLGIQIYTKDEFMKKVLS